MLNIQLKRIPERKTTWRCASEVLKDMAKAKHRVGECESLETDTAFHRLSRTADAMKPYVSPKAGTTPDPMTIPDTPPPLKLSMAGTESKANYHRPMPRRPTGATSILNSTLYYLYPPTKDPSQTHSSAS